MASVSCFMTSTRRICPLTFNVISRSTAPGAPGCPKMGARNRYAVDDTAAPAAITPLMNARRDTPRSGIMVASAISLSDIERLPQSVRWLQTRILTREWTAYRTKARGARQKILADQARASPAAPLPGRDTAGILAEMAPWKHDIRQ